MRVREGVGRCRRVPEGNRMVCGGAGTCSRVQEVEEGTGVCRRVHEGAEGGGRVQEDDGWCRRVQKRAEL